MSAGPVRDGHAAPPVIPVAGVPVMGALSPRSAIASPLSEGMMLSPASEGAGPMEPTLPSDGATTTPAPELATPPLSALGVEAGAEDVSPDEHAIPDVTRLDAPNIRANTAQRRASAPIGTTG